MLQDGDIMQLLQMDVVDEDSQHTVELMSKSSSLPVPATATGGMGAADVLGSSIDLRRAASTRAPSNLRHTTGPHTAAAAGAAGFSFKTFGKEQGAGGGTAALQVGWNLLLRWLVVSAGASSARLAFTPVADFCLGCWVMSCGLPTAKQ